MYQRILVPVDGSEASNLGLAEAIRLAGLTKGCLRLLHVVDDLSFSIGIGAHASYSGDWLPYLRQSGNAILAQAQAKARQSGIAADVVMHDNFHNSLNELVSEEARKWAADLIVLGTHGRRGVGRMLMGSGAESILRSAPVPVLLVRAAAEGSTAQAGSGAAPATLPPATLPTE